jgi:hypothetical protein
MTVYALPESELRIVALANTLATAFLSAASGFASLAVGIWINAAMQAEWNAATLILAKFASPILVVVSIFCLVLAWWSKQARGSMIDQIKRESSGIR